MSTAPKQHSYTLQSGDKAATVMVYTQTLLAWGDVILKESIRPSTWLRTQAIPHFARLYDVQVLKISQNCSLKPVSYNDLFVPSCQIIAYHLKPPTSDPLDYEPNEPHRKMEPLTALVGSFRFDGCLRMSQQSDIDRTLDVVKEAFIGLYDLTISLPDAPGFGQIHTPFALVRCDSLLYSSRTA